MLIIIGGNKIFFGKYKFVDYITLAFVIIGSINWGLVGLFDINIVSMFFGSKSFMTTGIYAIIAISGLYCITLYPRRTYLYNDGVEKHRNID